MSRRHSIDCSSCGAEVTNGLALCATCRAALLLYLEFLPVYFRNLSRWRPSTTSTSRPVPGSREPTALGARAADRVGDQLEETHAEVVGWLRALVDDRPGMIEAVEPLFPLEDEPFVRQGCALLATSVDSLATLPWVGELVRMLGHHEALLREETERVVPGWYAGACSHCDVATYVVPGLTWVTCSSCGVTTNVSDHLGVIAQEARGWADRPRSLAVVVVALTDETSVARVCDRIRQWAARGKLTKVRSTALVTVWDEEADAWAHREVEAGHPRYRLGEVLDLVGLGNHEQVAS